MKDAITTILDLNTVGWHLERATELLGTELPEIRYSLQTVREKVRTHAILLLEDDLRRPDGTS